MQNARHPKTHRELCELACRFLRNNGFKVVFSDRFTHGRPAVNILMPWASVTERHVSLR